MLHRVTRRTLIQATAGTVVLGQVAIRRAAAQASSWTALGAPIGAVGDIPGAGFTIGHGFACENTWYSPGWWHTGEDWYAIDGDTGGAEVYAVASGDVVFAGYDYPGRVVIVRQADELYSMYGHLDFETAVGDGDVVQGGDRLGRVLTQVGGRAPSHLHYEMRTFLFANEVNGDNPRYGVNCGPNCAPGPGYWPMDAPELPVGMGWLNPTHVQAGLARTGDTMQRFAVTVRAPQSVTLRDVPNADGATVADVSIDRDSYLNVLDISAGAADTGGTSARAYDLWLKCASTDDEGWVQAAVPSDRETGSDGRPSAVDRPLLFMPRERGE